MTKSELRTAFLNKRKTISSDESAEFSRRIAERFFDVCDLVRVENLHCYIPILKFNEIDTLLICNRIWSDFPHIQTAAPRIELETGELHSFVFNSETKFVENTWGVNEPSEGEIVEAKSLDLVIVPLLCFDESGFRVGYGKGFYDKFLAQCRPDCMKVGLSFFPPVDRIDDAAEFDVKIDQCITPDEILAFMQ